MTQIFSVYEHDKPIQRPHNIGTAAIYPNPRILAFIDWIDLDISVGSRIKIHDEIYTIIGKSISKNWYGRIDKASISVVHDP